MNKELLLKKYQTIIDKNDHDFSQANYYSQDDVKEHKEAARFVVQIIKNTSLPSIVWDKVCDEALRKGTSRLLAFWQVPLPIYSYCMVLRAVLLDLDIADDDLIHFYHTQGENPHHVKVKGD